MTSTRPRIATAVSRSLIALVVALGLAACGEAAPGTEPSSTAPDATASPSPDAPSTEPAPVPSSSGSIPAPGTDPTATPPVGATTSVTVVLDETGKGATVSTTLTCDPPGGSHRDPAGACAAIVAAGGVAAFAPVPASTMCTEIYGGPQVATVRGTVDGEAVSATFSRTNGCEIGRWDRLAVLLGSAGGV